MIGWSGDVWSNQSDANPLFRIRSLADSAGVPSAEELVFWAKDLRRWATWLDSTIWANWVIGSTPMGTNPRAALVRGEEYRAEERAHDNLPGHPVERVEAALES
jgi:hypothetical protein